MSDRTHEQNRAELAESERKIAHGLGRLEATYEALPRDEELIAEIMAETGADRERVVERLQLISERKIARLGEEHPTLGPSDAAPTDPAVKRFRELLS